jgi:glycyl-tRNA synthetase
MRRVVSVADTRQDELGTPYCVTVDFDSMDDDAVTIRFRDSTEQERVSVDELPDRLGELIAEYPEGQV